MDDFKKLIYGVLIGFVLLIVGYVSLLFFFSCGFDLSCKQAEPIVAQTPIPSLIPATLPAPTRFVAPTPTAVAATGEATEQPETGTIEIPRPSNPGEAGQAVNLTGDAGSGETIFAANCVSCHGQQGVGGIVNPGSAAGTVPALNPIDPRLKDPDKKIFAYNLDLFLEHGSKPEGPGPVFAMPAWGDLGALTPQQIADVIAYLISLNP